LIDGGRCLEVSVSIQNILFPPYPFLDKLFEVYDREWDLQSWDPPNPFAEGTEVPDVNGTQDPIYLYKHSPEKGLMALHDGGPDGRLHQAILVDPIDPIHKSSPDAVPGAADPPAPRLGITPEATALHGTVTAIAEELIAGQNVIKCNVGDTDRVPKAQELIVEGKFLVVRTRCNASKINKSKAKALWEGDKALSVLL
jgi:hypothetical protein